LEAIFEKALRSEECNVFPAETCISPQRLHATGALLMNPFLEKRGRLSFTFAEANRSACE
jgi:hypothetical protein